MATKKHRYGIFFTALTFAVTASFAATAPATALGLDTETDSSTSVDGSVSTENGDSEAEGNANAETTSESDVTLSDSDAGVSNSAGVEATTDTSMSVAESGDSENGDSEDNTGADAEAEASGEGEADVSADTVAPVNGEGNEVGFGMELLLRSNVLSMAADPVELEEGDVEAKTASESEANFDSDFTYYTVNHGFDYETAIYREPARLGGENVELAGHTGGTFWLGVSAPDENGAQSEINHQGKTTVYLETEDGWKSLEAQFDGQGELQHVNGVTPVVPEEETEELTE